MHLAQTFKGFQLQLVWVKQFLLRYSFRTIFYIRAGTDHNGKSETESKQNGHPENGENGTVGEERKRKHDDTSVIGDQSDEDVKKESNGTTDVNGNEGPDAKKRKLGHIENGHKNEVVRYYDIITFRSYTTKQAD